MEQTLTKNQEVFKWNLDEFCEFAKYADLKLFVKIYGERLGNHFWGKHIDFHQRNMTWTYNDMETHYREKMVKYISEREVEK